MTDPLFQQIQEAQWRRKLSPSEEQALRRWLAAHPDAEQDWEIEAALSAALKTLPDVPVSSNFTARVVSQALAQNAAAPRATTAPSRWQRLLRSLAPKVAFAVLVLGLAITSYERHTAAQRAELARKIATVSSLPALQDPDLLRDFEIIRRLDQVPHPDEQLLAVLQ